MDVGKVSIQVPECPDASDDIEARIRQGVDELTGVVRNDNRTLRLMDFERSRGLAIKPRVEALARKRARSCRS